MSDFEQALEAELLVAARRRAAKRRRVPTLVLATALTGAVAAFAGVPALIATDSVTPPVLTAPPCSAQESLLRAGPCTSNPFSSLSP